MHVPSKYRLLIVLLTLLAAALNAVAAQAASPAQTTSRAGRVIVKMRVAPRSTPPRAAQTSYRVLAVEDLGSPGLQIWRVPVGEEAAVAALAASRSDVEYAEPDSLQSVHGTADDSLFKSHQWNLPRVEAPRAWDTTSGSAEVVVAVIDSGFDVGHPDSPPRLRLGCDYVSWSSLGRWGGCPRVAHDPNGHGTHVAGIVGAARDNRAGIAGVAPDATVLVIRTANGDGSSFVSDVSAAIREATDAGARVINLSLGGPSRSRTQESAIKYALERGVVVVASAGNSYLDGNPTSYPAAFPGVIAVGATTSSDQRATYSSTGPHLSLVAPGGSGDGSSSRLSWITSLYPRSKGTYRMMAGTSQAAPHVSAAAALVLSARPSMSGEDVGDVLRATARPLSDSAPDSRYGHGLLQIEAALRAVIRPTATPTPTVSRPEPMPTPVAVLAPIGPEPAPSGQRRHFIPTIPKAVSRV